MNMHSVSRLTSGLLFAAILGVTGCAATGGYDRGGYYDRGGTYDRGGYGYDYNRGNCRMCGVVEDIDPIYNRGAGGDTAALGTILGVVIGAVAGNQIGDGDGQKIATVGGAVAGGVIGHEIDQRNDNQRAWRIIVRLDDGRYATVTQQRNPRVSVGDYVVVRNDQVYPR